MNEKEIMKVIESMPDDDFSLALLKKIKKVVVDKIGYIQFGHCKECGNEINKNNSLYLPVGLCKSCFDNYDDDTKQQMLDREQDALFDYIAG